MNELWLSDLSSGSAWDWGFTWTGALQGSQVSLSRHFYVLMYLPADCELSGNISLSSVVLNVNTFFHSCQYKTSSFQGPFSFLPEIYLLAGGWRWKEDEWVHTMKDFMHNPLHFPADNLQALSQ